MDWAGIATVLGAATVLVGAIAAAAVQIIKALKEQTRVTVENTQDRAVKTAATNEVLTSLAAAAGVQPPRSESSPVDTAPPPQ